MLILVKTQDVIRIHLADAGLLIRFLCTRAQVLGRMLRAKRLDARSDRGGTKDSSAKGNLLSGTIRVNPTVYSALELLLTVKSRKRSAQLTHLLARHLLKSNAVIEVVTQAIARHGVILLGRPTTHGRGEGEDADQKEARDEMSGAQSWVLIHQTSAVEHAVDRRFRMRPP